jgi:hypothetical protein
MEHSATYNAIQDMIQHGLLVMIFPELASTLALLEQGGLITSAEHNSLMILAEQKNSDSLLNWWDTISVDPTSALPGT